jgi:hypothetical protein
MPQYLQVYPSHDTDLYVHNFQEEVDRFFSLYKNLKIHARYILQQFHFHHVYRHFR